MIHAVETITAALDVLAVYPFAANNRERIYIISHAASSLNAYPRPGNCASTREIGAHLFTSNARNIAKLGLLRLQSKTACIKAMQAHLEAALSLLVD